MLEQTAARPAEIEDQTNRFVIHRISAALLAPAIRLGLHPNLVSLAGLGFAGLAGTAFYHWHQPVAVLIGFVMMCAWHVCDGLDGQLARATNRSSAFGRVVDGVCDYLAFFAVLIPVAVSFPDWGPKLTLCLTAGGAHALQAMWFEGEREAWKRRARGEFVSKARASTGHWIEAGHNAMERLLGSGDRDIDPVLAANPAVRSGYFAATAPLLRALGPVGANGRTIALPIFCLLGHAEWFWYWELVGLTSYALIMAFALRAAERRIVAAA